MIGLQTVILPFGLPSFYILWLPQHTYTYYPDSRYNLLFIHLFLIVFLFIPRKFQVIHHESCDFLVNNHYFLSATDFHL